MTEQTGNIDVKFKLFSDHWRPKVIAKLNGQEMKLVKVQGIFPWHTHDDIEEMFIVWSGQFRVEFRDHISNLGPGDYIVVPRGVEHRTAADMQALVMIFEPTDVRNTGDVTDAIFTAPNDVTI
jgi:mannose-6-phosphate isomerase-like protein (cupin superfamily)